MSNKESVGKREHALIMAENKELRRLWIENEGDIIKVKSMLNRFFHLKWYQRLFIKWDDWRLWRDVPPDHPNKTITDGGNDE